MSVSTSASTVSASPLAAAATLVTITASDGTGSDSLQFAVPVTEPEGVSLTPPDGMAADSWWPACEGGAPICFSPGNTAAGGWFTLIHGSVFDASALAGWTPPVGPDRDWDLFPDPLWFHNGRAASVTLTVTARPDADGGDGASHFQLVRAGPGSGDAVLARFFVREVDPDSPDRAALCP